MEPPTTTGLLLFCSLKAKSFFGLPSLWFICRATAICAATLALFLIKLMSVDRKRESGINRVEIVVSFRLSYSFSGFFLTLSSILQPGWMAWLLFLLSLLVQPRPMHQLSNYWWSNLQKRIISWSLPLECFQLPFMACSSGTGTPINIPDFSPSSCSLSMQAAASFASAKL